MHPCTLQTGDYAFAHNIQDKYEDGDLSISIVIERKASVSELAGNIVQPRFWREVERLALFKHPYLLLEFSELDVAKYPVGSGLPRYLWKKVRVRAPFIFSKIEQIEKCGIEVVWAEDRQGARKFIEEIYRGLSRGK